MAATEELKALVASMPDPAKNGTYVDLDDAKIAQIDKVMAQLSSGGRDSVVGLIDLLDEMKAHYALHVLAVRMSGAEDKARAGFALAVASQLNGGRPKAVQKYLIEQLQVAGGREVVEALGKALLDTELCDPAARALVAIGHGAAEPFLAALPKVVGRSRLSVLKKLGALRCQKAEGAFTQALGDEDADIRIAGAWALARIGAGADTLIERADAGKGWERINLTDACMTLAETLAAAGKEKEAAAIYVHLRKTRTDDSEKHILDAATRALRAIEKGN